MFSLGSGWPITGKIAGAALVAAALSACADIQAIPGQRERLYFIGQDLGAIRGYNESQCCLDADGGTAYLGFFSLLNADANYGGLGVDEALQPVASEAGWGSGPVSAWKTAKEARGAFLAIGLSMAQEPEPGDFAKIADGKFDAEIDHLAAFIAKTEKTTLLRIGYEFDGAWNAPYADHEAYIAVWRHIVERLRAADVANVQFVWQGSASPIDDVIEQRHENIADWYPGDAYVDWIGTSWFLLADEIPEAAKSDQFTPQSHRELTDELLMFARARGKPVFVAELSPQGFDLEAGTRRNIAAIWDGNSGEDVREMSPEEIWQAWYAPFLDYLAQHKDVIRAIAYINADWDSQPMWGAPYAQGYWGDSRLQTNPEIAAKWNKKISAWRASQSD